MSAETQRQYARLLIKAEAARAIGDLEDYRVSSKIARRLTRNARSVIIAVQ